MFADYYGQNWLEKNVKYSNYASDCLLYSYKRERISSIYWACQAVKLVTCVPTT